MTHTPKRILVVEDYIQLRDLMQTVLHEVGGHVVVTAGDFAGAEAHLARGGVDLVVLDIGLPGIRNGWDVAKIVRERKSCPILVITGRDIPPQERKMMVGPADGFLLKPFRMDVLCAEVERLVGHAERKPLNPSVKREQRRGVRHSGQDADDPRKSQASIAFQSTKR